MLSRAVILKNLCINPESLGLEVPIYTNILAKDRKAVSKDRSKSASKKEFSIEHTKKKEFKRGKRF